ncbi:MAG: hypothetical protein ACHQUC_06395, partial [Chlamydiales bacterium]
MQSIPFKSSSLPSSSHSIIPNQEPLFPEAYVEETHLQPGQIEHNHNPHSCYLEEVNLQTDQKIRAILYQPAQQPPFLPPVPTPSSLPPSKIYQKENTPVISGNSFQTSEIDKIVLAQLQGLIQICDRLSDSQSDFLKTLLELSWGVGSLSKEKKFSDKKWIAVIIPRHWILLEDIARQITNQNLDINLVGKFSRVEVPILVSALTTLIELEQNPSSKPPEVPYCLFEHATIFEENFDQFILHRVNRNIQIMRAALGEQNPTDWLKNSYIQANETHVKALFRTIEVIGEASKLLNTQAKAQIPLFKGQRGKLWEQLRDKLHHNGKERCWDIAHFATEKWGILLTFIIFQPQDNHLEQILQELHCLCQEDHFRQIRRRWNKSKADFQSGTDLSPLLRLLFGFEPIDWKNHQEIWKMHARPYLLPEANVDENQANIIGMFFLGNGILMSDIQPLVPKGTLQGKAGIITSVKALLQPIDPTHSEEQVKTRKTEFEHLINQLVFLPKDTQPTAELIQYDCEKKRELLSLWDQRSQGNRTKTPLFSSDTFRSLNFLTELGVQLDLYVELKVPHISQSINKVKRILKRIQTSWPVVIDNSTLNSSRGFKKDLSNKEFTKKWEQLQSELHWIELSSNCD